MERTGLVTKQDALNIVEALGDRDLDDLEHAINRERERRERVALRSLQVRFA